MRHLTDIRPDALSDLKFFGLNGIWMVVPAISGYLLIQLTDDPHYDSRAAARALFGKGGGASKGRPPSVMSGSARLTAIQLDQG